MMKQRSKRYRGLLAAVGADLKLAVQPAQAAVLVKKLSKAKFTESIDLSVHLNLDTKKADQQFRGSFAFPNGTGKAVRVIVFCDDGDKVAACLAGGAVKAGGDDLVKEVEAGFIDFDIAISSPKMMRSVGRLGKVLGPRGLMPSPKAGTVTEDVANAVKEFKGGRTEYRTDPAGNVHVRVGNVTFSEQHLAENVSAFLVHVSEHRPSTVKGDFIKNVTISSTMGPGVRVAFANKEA
jgi:large subunit ribosomal protein L1